MYAQETKYGPRLLMTLCYVSSEDEAHPVESLQSQTATSLGWQSGKHCRYPQELGFRFEGRVTLDYVRILSHERKISSCIDVFTADATEEEMQRGVCVSYEKANFVRLGHVRFSSNEKNSFNARELKTVGIRKACTYLRLVLRRPHHNTYNIFQQVGVVAIAAHGNLLRHFTSWDSNMRAIVIGENIEAPMDEMLPLTNADGANKIPRLAGSASASAERRVAELSALKARAVAEEDYDLADALKRQIAVIERSHGEIKQLEEEKAQAVAAEDYQRAKALKQRIDALHQAAYSNSSPLLGSQTRPPAPPVTVMDSERQVPGVPHSAPATSSPPRFTDTHPYDRRPSPTAHDDIAVGGKGFYDVDAAVRSGFGGGGGGAGAGAAAAEVPADGAGADWERELNKLILARCGEHGAPLQLSGELDSESRLYEKDLGIFCAACMLSKKGQQREAAIRTIASDEGLRILRAHTSAASEQLLAYFASAGRGFTDPFAGVVFAACEFIEELASGRSSESGALAQLSGGVVKLLPDMMSRLGDANGRIREGIEGAIISLARSPIGPDRIVSLLLADPDKQGRKAAGYRTHISRINILSTFVDDWGVNKAQNPNALDTVSLVHRVLLPSLQHSNGEVREAASRLFAKLAVLDPRATAPLLENLKPAQRSVIEQHIQEVRGARAEEEAEQRASAGAVAAAVALAAGPDLEADTQSIHSSSSPSTASDIQNLLQIAEQLTAQRGKVPRSQGGANIDSLKQAAQHDSSAVSSSSSSKAGDSATRSLRTCQFCGEFNPKFDEAHLDAHYVRACPMLCPCPLCDQVTEISTLQQHLVSECEGHTMVRQCPRCREAIRAEDIDRHVAARSCIEHVPTHSVCPLCHARFRAGVEGWRQHLATSPGCPNNPRKYDGTGAV